MPPELRGQWEKDRAKKAENKRKRALERIQLAADPLAQHKGGKKGRKTMLAAARADGDADLPNRVTDLVSLEQQIRRFLADIGGSNTMALPPANKQTRAQVHQLAMAFNLKSQSKGKGNTRYTTLTKTSKSGVGIQEGKIRRILREATGGTWQGPGGGGGKGRSKAMSLATHREGEEVGKVGVPPPFREGVQVDSRQRRRHRRSERRTWGSRCWHEQQSRQASMPIPGVLCAFAVAVTTLLKEIAY